MQRFDDFLSALMMEYNGCGWLNEESPEYRERGDWDKLIGQEIIIEDMYKIKDYHAVLLRGDRHVYLTCGALKDMLNKYGDMYGQYMRNVVLRVGVKREYKGDDGTPREYRPFTVVGAASACESDDSGKPA